MHTQEVVCTLMYIAYTMKYALNGRVSEIPTPKSLAHP